MKTHKELYQAHTVAMGEALRAASDTLVELSTADLAPGDLVNAIDDITLMLVIGREHAVRMCIYDVLMQERKRKTPYPRTCSHDVGDLLSGECGGVGCRG